MAVGRGSMTGDRIIPPRPSGALPLSEGESLNIKSILRAIMRRYAHFAQSKARGTRTAETAMCRQRASGRAAGTGPERARAAGCAHRRTGAAGGTGRYSDQAGCRSWVDEARTLRRTGKLRRSDRRASAHARPCQPRGPPPPQRNAAMRNAPDREATIPERNLTIAERYGRNA